MSAHEPSKISCETIYQPTNNLYFEKSFLMWKQLDAVQWEELK